MLAMLRERGRRRRTSERLCASVVERAREPVFFRDCGVADTIDGRFDVLVLHAWLALERLQADDEDNLARSLVDALFVRLEEALREQGAGDMSLGRRMKTMASAFYGRLRAYNEAGDESALAAALLRNLYRGEAARVEQAAALARYVLSARAELAQGRLDRRRLDRGRLEFGPLPSGVHRA